MNACAGVGIALALYTSLPIIVAKASSFVGMSLVSFLAKVERRMTSETNAVTLDCSHAFDIIVLVRKVPLSFRHPVVLSDIRLHNKYIYNL